MSLGLHLLYSSELDMGLQLLSALPSGPRNPLHTCVASSSQAPASVYLTAKGMCKQINFQQCEEDRGEEKGLGLALRKLSWQTLWLCKQRSLRRQADNSRDLPLSCEPDSSFDCEFMETPQPLSQHFFVCTWLSETHHESTLLQTSPKVLKYPGEPAAWRVGDPLCTPNSPQAKPPHPTAQAYH